MPNEFAARIDGKYLVICSMPDVCKLPNNIPVPFPVLEKLSTTLTHAKKCKFNGKFAVMLKSKTPAVKGDQAGVAKGVKSGSVGKKTQFISGKHCPITKIEKSFLIRVGDTVNMNNKNTKGKVVFAPAPVQGAIKDNGAINV